MAYIASRWLLTAALTTLSTALLLGCNKSLDDTSPPPVASTTLGNQVDDTVVTAGVKAALLGDPLVKSFDLKVETRKGVVLLSGFVDSQSQIDQAVAVTPGGVRRGFG